MIDHVHSSTGNFLATIPGAESFRKKKFNQLKTAIFNDLHDSFVPLFLTGERKWSRKKLKVASCFDMILFLRDLIWMHWLEILFSVKCYNCLEILSIFANLLMTQTYHVFGCNLILLSSCTMRRLNNLHCQCVGIIRGQQMCKRTMKDKVVSLILTMCLLL